MVPDRQKVWPLEGMDGRTHRRCKNLTLRLRLGIIKGNQGNSNMLANIMPADTPSDPWNQNSTFFRTWSCCILNKRESRVQQHGSKKMPADPSPPPTLGVKRLKFNFFRKKHVAYQIKGNRQCRNMVANILPAAPHPPPNPLRRSKFIFSEHGHIAYQRELQMQQYGIKCRQRYNKLEIY